MTKYVAKAISPSTETCMFSFNKDNKEHLYVRKLLRVAKFEGGMPTSNKDFKYFAYLDDNWVELSITKKTVFGSFVSFNK